MDCTILVNRLGGKLCTTSHGKEIIWNGHLCEGANLTPKPDENFCLWTRCGKHDVPAGKGYEGDVSEVTCTRCLEEREAAERITKEDKREDVLDNSQFGVGA